MVVRYVATIGGIYLGILWVVGLSYEATFWMPWLDGLAAFCAFALAAAAPRPPQLSSVLGPMIISSMPGYIFLMGLIFMRTPWMIWTNLVAAGLFFTAGLINGNLRRRFTYPPTPFVPVVPTVGERI